MFYVKIHKLDGNRILVAVCDEDLLGKKFAEKGLQLDLTSLFYRGKLTEDKETIEVMKKSYCFNIVGKKIVDLALKEGFISKANIITIKKVPSCQGLILSEE